MDLGQVVWDICPTGQKATQKTRGESWEAAPGARYVVGHVFCAHDQRGDESYGGRVLMYIWFILILHTVLQLLKPMARLEYDL